MHVLSVERGPAGAGVRTWIGERSRSADQIRDHRPRWRHPVLIGLAVVATLLVALVVVAGWMLSRIGFPLDGSLNIGSKPIPVPSPHARRCDSCTTTRYAPTALVEPGVVGHGDTVTGSRVLGRDGPDAAAARRVAPPRASSRAGTDRRQFRITIRDVEVGQAGLLYFRDPHRYMSATVRQLFEGTYALWQASGLVGARATSTCGTSRTRPLAPPA